MNLDQASTRAALRRPHPVWWVIAASLVFLTIKTIGGGDADPTALAQSVRTASARGIFAFTGQLTPSTFGTFMVDVDTGTIWCYELTNDHGVKRLQLVAARSWIFDRYLEEYNIEEPTPREVEALVKQQRALRSGAQQLNNP